MRRILRGLTLVAGLIGLPLAGHAQVAAGVDGSNVTHIVAGGYTLSELPTPYGQPRTWTSASASGTITLTESSRDARIVILHDSANLSYQINIALKMFGPPDTPAKITPPPASGGLAVIKSTALVGIVPNLAKTIPLTEADAGITGFNATGADVVGGGYRLVSAGQWQDSLGNVYSEIGRDAASVYLISAAGRTVIDVSRRAVVHPNNAAVPIGAVFAAATATAPTLSGASPIVAGSAIGAAELQATMQWIAYEMQIDNTAICYKPSYLNGAAKAPVDCGAGEMLLRSACFPNCRDGYSIQSGTTMCVETCPPGYTNNGSSCHYDNYKYDAPLIVNQTCYTIAPASCTTVNQTCSPNLCVPYFGCTGTVCTGGSQVCSPAVQRCGNITHLGDCRTGYSFNGGVCLWTLMPASGDWTGPPSDPVKRSYNVVANGAPRCSGSDVLVGGQLCFPTPKPNYACPGGDRCFATCAAGTVDCGSPTCANSRQSCGLSVGNTQIGPLTVVLNIATDGVGGAAILAARDSIKAANDALRAGGNGLGSTAVLQTSIQTAMNATRNNLASVTSPDIEAQIAGKWGKGSAAYDTIGRSWALVDLEILLRQESVYPANFIELLADETRVIETIPSYANPPCEPRTAIP